MKTTEEFKAAVYQKRDARAAAAKRTRKRFLLCLPLALVVAGAAVLFPLTRHTVLLPAGSGGPYTLRAQPGALRDLSLWALSEEQFAEEQEQTADLDKEDLDDEALKQLTELLKALDRKYEEMRQSAREEMDRNLLDPGFSQAVNQFTRDSTRLLAENFEENACYSPISLYYALALLGSGAKNDTAREFCDVLHVPDMNWAADQCQRFYRQHYHDNPGTKFQLANSLWLDDRCTFQKNYLQKAADSFYASLFNADFADPGMGDAVSRWIADNTGGLLEPALEFDPQTMMAVVNTVYLAEQWNEEFVQSFNTEDAFYKADGSTVTAEYMHRTDLFGSAFSEEDFTRASLRLKEGDQVIFILPKEGVSPEELLNDPETFEKMFFPRSWDDAIPCELQWSVPKFSFDSNYDLKDMLASLGLETAFDATRADFSGVGRSDRGDLYVSSAQQGVHMGVHEQGIEAAAYTIMTMDGAGAAADLPLVEMKLDRPFLFAVLSGDRLDDETYDAPSGTLLFVGVCGDPVK